MPAVAAPSFGSASEIRDGRRGEAVSWPDMVAALASADAAFIGEQHDDPRTHVIERELFEALASKVGGRMALAMEMFERDQQPVLDEYLAGRISEEEMGKRIKLWPNYPTDYRPAVEAARQVKAPVMGSNAPAAIVRRVGREGLAVVLPSLSADDRKQIAADFHVPPESGGDEYARRFGKVIGAGHGDGQTMDVAMIRRFFEAQCVRDDTMAESVARLLDAGRFICHINGSFHSDAGLGTVQRLLWRRPLIRVSTVKIIPFKGKISKTEGRGEADFLVFVPDTRKEEQT